MTAAPFNTPVPDRIGRYRIEAELGRGMMGVIYRAADPDLGRTVALKTVALAFSVSEDDREAFQRRFLEEARIAARLSHPGIVVVHEVGRDADTGVLYMALEYLRGRTLAQVLAAEGRRPWEEALRLVAAVAEALHHAHAAGVVHRDIKPANIMVLESGDPKILDFGVAKAPAVQLTAAGQLFGTPAYMSPEQACGLAVDGRSDLFSLGCVLYQALTAKTPFNAENIPLLLSRILNDDPAPPSSIVPEIPAAVDALLAKALAKDRRQRHDDGRAFADHIVDVLSRRPLRARKRGPASVTAAAGPAAAEPPVDTLDLSLLLDEDLAADASVSPPPETAPLSPARTLPASRARGRRSVMAGGLALAALAAVLGGVWLSRGPWTAAPPAALPSPLPPAFASGETAPVASVATTGAGVPAPGKEPPPPGPAPERAAAEPAPPEAETGRPARLAVQFEHHLRDGFLRVWVGGALRLERPLRATRARGALFMKVYRGRVSETVEVPVGRHRVRVEITAEGPRRVAESVETFRPGSTRRLEVSVGMLRRTIELRWR